MYKIVDGVELLRMILDEEIKEETHIKELYNDLIIILKQNVLYYYNARTEENCELLEDYDLSILRGRFEILSEEDKEIDIQSIEELTKEIKCITADANNPHAYGMEIGSYDTIKIGDKINEIIKVIKQLDKKIK